MTMMEPQSRISPVSRLCLAYNTYSEYIYRAGKEARPSLKLSNTTDIVDSLAFLYPKLESGCICAIGIQCRLCSSSLAGIADPIAHTTAHHHHVCLCTCNCNCNCNGNGNGNILTYRSRWTNHSNGRKLDNRERIIIG